MKRFLYLALIVFQCLNIKAQSTKSLLVVKNKLAFLNNLETPYSSELSYLTTYQGVYEKGAAEYFHNLDLEGKWADINYQSPVRNAWPAVLHLYRTLLLTKYYASNQDTLVLSKIHIALNYWIKNDFLSGNWWHNQINVPYVFSTILLNLSDKTKEEELNYYFTKIVPRIQQKNATGQNKIWEQDCLARLALLRNDEQGFASAIQTMQQFLTISTKEGIQPDFSFQQHGTMLQFGNYGLHFVNSLAFWMSVAQETPYQFEKDKQINLLKYCENGLAQTVFKKNMDITAIGRQLRPNAASTRGLTIFRDFQLLKTIDKTVDSKLLLSGFDTLDNSIYSADFWRSAYYVQRNPQRFQVSVKTSGKYVARIESINAENALGAYLSDGVTLFQTSGEEYERILPLWKWNRLPGITADTAINVKDVHLLRTANRLPFVGQLSDGYAGISVMDYQRGAVKAQKSYFFSNNLMLALGNIHADTDKKNLVTGINQQKANGKTIKQGAYKDLKWIYFDDKLYCFTKQNQGINSTIEHRKGNWSEVDAISDNKEFEAAVFDLYLGHKQAKKYAYFVVSAVSEADIISTVKQIASYVVVNEEDKQAFDDKQQLMAAFYKPGEIKVKSIKITANQACLVLYDKRTKTLTVADPTRQLKQINIKVNQQMKTIALPTSDLKGSSIAVKL